MTACQPDADQSWRAQVEPVPEVSLARREAGDVKRLSDMRRRIEQTLAQPDLSAPEAARAYSELGRQYMAHEYDRAALVALGNLVAIDPNWRTGHYLRAVLLQHQGQLEQAQAHLSEALRIDPNDGNTLLRLGDVALSGGDAAAAKDYFERAMAIPSAALSGQAGLGRTAFFDRDYPAAVTALSAVLEQRPQASALRHPLAQSLRERGEIEAARDQLEQILAKNPKHVQTLQSLVMLELAAQQPDSAKRRLAEAMALPMEAAERSSLLALTAHLAETDGDTSAAMAAYRNAVDADASNFDAWLSLAMLQRAHGSQVDAQQSFSAALELQPEHAQARLELARTQIMRGQWQAARNTLDAGNLDYRADNQVLITLIELLAASPDAAVRDGDRALRLAEQATRETRNLRFMELTAMAAAEIGEFEQAARLIERLIDTAQKRSTPAQVQQRLSSALVSYRSRQASRMSAD